MSDYRVNQALGGSEFLPAVLVQCSARMRIVHFEQLVTLLLSEANFVSALSNGVDSETEAVCACGLSDCIIHRCNCMGVVRSGVF